MRIKLFKTNLTEIQKICLAGLFMALAVILQKVVAVNLLSLFGLFAMMISLKVPLFVNLWSFLQIHIFRKDYGTLTSRTGIWASVFGLLCKNPIDLVFGLGYKTGNFAFSCARKSY